MNRPLRPCRHPSCTVLVRGGYCDKHKPKENRSEESKQWHNWYNTKLWKDKLRPAQLMREPFCRECAKHGVRTKAEHVDHIIPFEGDWQLFISSDNHQSLCAACHGRKTAEETRKKIRAKRI